jgi:hypothetical protein
MKEALKEKFGRFKPWDYAILFAILVTILIFLILDLIFWSHAVKQGIFYSVIILNFISDMIVEPKSRVDCKTVASPSLFHIS